MERLKLRYYPDAVLRKKAEKIKNFDAEIRSLAQEMISVMQEAKGVGLAGNQVGKLKRIVVIGIIPEILEEPLVLLNPEIKKMEGSLVEEEGCLSFPGVSASVRRHLMVRANFRNLAGEKMQIDAKGTLARIIQHEMDHLNGVLYPDRLSFFARKKLLRDYRQKRKTVSLTAEKKI